jgi:hypothetical protein
VDDVFYVWEDSHSPTRPSPTRSGLGRNRVRRRPSSKRPFLEAQLRQTGLYDTLTVNR